MSSSTLLGPIQKLEEKWEAILTPEQFRILRLKGTEYPGIGEYDKHFAVIYKCAGCGTPLSKSSTKFNSGCDWAAFYETLMGGGQRSHVLPVEDIWGMYSKVRGLIHRKTSDSVLTTFPSSSFPASVEV